MEAPSAKPAPVTSAVLHAEAGALCINPVRVGIGTPLHLASNRFLSSLCPIKKFGAGASY
jgi:hypothetical protein